MDWNLIHCIKDTSYNIIFLGNTLDIILVNSSTVKSIEELKNHVFKIEYSSKLLETIKKIEVISKKNIIKNKKHITSRTIDKITLHVTNGCNLKCKYCYANEGTYNSSKGLLTQQKADDFLSFCQNSFDKIERIMFFGGEPLLNLNVMSYICDSFHLKYKNNDISYIPKFGIITNGTILNEQIIEFIRKYISNITISIDGPQEINDKNRIFKNGSGTYMHINNFINTIKNRTNVKLFLEATFTKEHIRYGYTRNEIKNFLQKKFDIKTIVVDENSIDLNTIKNFNPKYTQINVSDFPYLPNIFWQVLDRISLKEASSICPIYKKVVAISTLGDIYPCHLLVGNKNICLGNIKGNNIYSTPSMYKNFTNKIISKENHKCQKCWANRICGGCAVNIFYDKEYSNFKNKPNDEYCNSIKECLSKIILLIVHIKKTPFLWEKLLEYKKNCL